jgi:hypothetical protein
MDVREAFIDTSIAPDKKGHKVGKTKRTKGTKIMAQSQIAVGCLLVTPFEITLHRLAVVFLTCHSPAS